MNFGFIWFWLLFGLGFVGSGYQTLVLILPWQAPQTELSHSPVLWSSCTHVAQHPTAKVQVPGQPATVQT